MLFCANGLQLLAPAINLPVLPVFAIIVG